MGCMIALWVFSQTYFQPARDVQLNIIRNSGGQVAYPASQPPAVYQGDSSTKSNPVVFGAPSGSSSSPGTPPSKPAAAGGGSLRPVTGSTGNPSRTGSTGLSVSRDSQSAKPGRTVPSGSQNTPGAENPSFRDSSVSRPTNVGGFSTPPAGQALGMEQAKRAPADSSSDRKYVPFRSSMANRPN